MAQRDVEFPQKMRIPMFWWFFWGKKKIELSCIILLAFCPVSSTGILAPSKAAHGSFWGEAPPLPLAGGAVEFFPVLVEGIRISRQEMTYKIIHKMQVIYCWPLQKAVCCVPVWSFVHQKAVCKKKWPGRSYEEAKACDSTVPWKQRSVIFWRL